MRLLMSLSAATLGWVTFCFLEEGKLTCCHVVSSILPSVTNSPTLSISRSSPLLASCISSRVYGCPYQGRAGKNESMSSCLDRKSYHNIFINCQTYAHNMTLTHHYYQKSVVSIRVLSGILYRVGFGKHMLTYPP